MKKTVTYLAGGIPMVRKLDEKQLAELQKMEKDSPVKTGEFFTTYKIISIK